MFIRISKEKCLYQFNIIVWKWFKPWILKKAIFLRRQSKNYQIVKYNIIFKDYKFLKVNPTVSNFDSWKFKKSTFFESKLMLMLIECVKIRKSNN